mmetsp:Transcript_16490/g.26496  ORF Transcript_16490/g.26496 Transcript_16490/m.26496 type:complete len:116 (+) Transcript_16490:113-460(+)
MQNSMCHNQNGAEESRREEDLTDDAKKNDCSDGAKGHPPLCLPEWHAAYNDLPIRIIILPEERHPYASQDANHDQALRVDYDRNNHQQQEYNGIVDLKVRQICLETLAHVSLRLR